MLKLLFCDLHNNMEFYTLLQRVQASFCLQAKHTQKLGRYLRFQKSKQSHWAALQKKISMHVQQEIYDFFHAVLIWQEFPV